MHTQEVQVIRTVAFHPCCHGPRQPQHVDQQSEAGFGVNSLPVAQRSGTSVWELYAVNMPQNTTSRSA
ncbi:hypothetical protein JOQ06_002722 [Pogonophryne albipinna]|uniref:Uncharacterized protein n=1 Tax=Pogonophryne albipinna TaxID=1090488 RepID=A0AAD6B8D0_9TELE|nr:hypothetical protein JOQ06_002722 [Pogonophryne albipinna]